MSEAAGPGLGGPGPRVEAKMELVVPAGAEGNGGREEEEAGGVPPHYGNLQPRGGGCVCGNPGSLPSTHMRIPPWWLRGCVLCLRAVKIEGGGGNQQTYKKTPNQTPNKRPGKVNSK